MRGSLCWWMCASCICFKRSLGPYDYIAKMFAFTIQINATMAAITPIWNGKVSFYPGDLVLEYSNSPYLNTIAIEISLPLVSIAPNIAKYATNQDPSPQITWLVAKISILNHEGDEWDGIKRTHHKNKAQKRPSGSIKRHMTCKHGHDYVGFEPDIAQRSDVLCDNKVSATFQYIMTHLECSTNTTHSNLQIARVCMHNNSLFGLRWWR